MAKLLCKNFVYSVNIYAQDHLKALPEELKSE